MWYFRVRKMAEPYELNVDLAPAELLEADMLVYLRGLGVNAARL